MRCVSRIISRWSQTDQALIERQSDVNQLLNNADLLVNEMRRVIQMYTFLRIARVEMHTGVWQRSFSLEATTLTGA